MKFEYTTSKIYTAAQIITSTHRGNHVMTIAPGGHMKLTYFV